MRRYGVAGIALGSSLGSTVNVVLHLRDLDRRIGAILGAVEWRAVGVSVVAAGAAAAAGAAVVGVVPGVVGGGPILSALLALGIFGVMYAALALALKHPDAARLWKLVT